MPDGSIDSGCDKDGLATAPLDHLAAARALGQGIALDDIEPLRRVLAAARPAEVARFLGRLAAGDRELAAAEAAARWRVTGDADDLDAAIDAAWAAFPIWAAAPTDPNSDPEWETQ